MEFNIKDLSKEDMDILRRKLLTLCEGYEPWADMMFLGGAGDEGVDHFPLNLDDIETIDITLVRREGPQEVK